MNATQLISRLTQTVGEKYIITDPAKPNNTVKATVLVRARRWQLSVRVRCWNVANFAGMC